MHCKVLLTLKLFCTQLCNFALERGVIFRHGACLVSFLTQDRMLCLRRAIVSAGARSAAATSRTPAALTRSYSTAAKTQVMLTRITASSNLTSKIIMFDVKCVSVKYLRRHQKRHNLVLWAIKTGYSPTCMDAMTGGTTKHVTRTFSLFLFLSFYHSPTHTHTQWY